MGRIILCVVWTLFVFSSVSVNPGRAYGIDWEAVSDLLNQAMEDVTDVESMVSTIQDFYGDPDLGGGLNFYDMISEFLNFEGLPAGGDLNDCLEDPVGCVCQYLGCLKAAAFSAPAAENPLLHLAQTMNALELQIGSGSTVTNSYNDLSNTLSTVYNANSEEQRALKKKRKARKRYGRNRRAYGEKSRRTKRFKKRYKKAVKRYKNAKELLRSLSSAHVVEVSLAKLRSSLTAYMSTIPK